MLRYSPVYGSEELVPPYTHELQIHLQPVSTPVTAPAETTPLIPSPTSQWVTPAHENTPKHAMVMVHRSADANNQPPEHTDIESHPLPAHPEAALAVVVPVSPLLSDV